ncbi:MAG TPA: chemotaxis protein, partial [Anaeromyxobacter sp.]|nr:chemotaxis protein [Anaeromyxobacter sp.]
MATRHFRYDWYGAAAGAGLPIVGTVIEAVRLSGGISPAALVAAHLSQPLLWIMDTTPLVLGGLGMVIVRQHRRLVRQSEEIVRLEQARRESFDRTASGLLHAARGLLGNVDDATRATTRTAATVRETTATMNHLSQAAAAAALTAETVIGLALQSERAGVQGLHHVDASSAELLRLAEEVRALSGRIEELSDRMRAVGGVAEVVAQVAERSDRAAAEAARAAERAGAGGADLAAAAAELRRQAAETGRAAVQVRELLSGLEGAARDALAAAETGGARAQAGAQVAVRTGEIIRGLSTALGESARAAKEIARVAQ